jgi:ubiquinone/menaquinone biosynthesis C-methylase UbiE
MGCGSGFALDYFKNAVGIDNSIKLLKKAKKPVVCCAAENLPFKDNSFDLVLCITAVHHFDLKTAIPEMLRVCKKGFVISVLKRVKNKDQIFDLINKKFNVHKELEEDKDIILLCTHPDYRK